MAPPPPLLLLQLQLSLILVMLRAMTTTMRRKVTMGRGMHDGCCCLFVWFCLTEAPPPL